MSVRMEARDFKPSVKPPLPVNIRPQAFAAAPQENQDILAKILAAETKSFTNRKKTRTEGQGHARGRPKPRPESHNRNLPHLRRRRQAPAAAAAPVAAA